MNHSFRNVFIVLLLDGIICFNSCKKDPPEVTTANISDITETSAVSGGNVTNNGGAEVTSRGVCWDTSQNPTMGSSKTSNGTGNGPFTSNMTGLTANTTYYVCAYATNSAGTAYGNQISFTTKSSIFQDIEGNIYNTVQIGDQIWMKENLKTTRYKDGGTIPLISDNTSWSYLSSPGYCWYNNDIGYKSIYGALYNWFTINTGKLCPIGWHVPSDAEWTTLTTYLGGTNVAGGKLKEAGTSHWTSPNEGATNETGFTALPGGSRLNNGTFIEMGISSRWWSSSEYSSSNAWYRVMYYQNSGVGWNDGGKGSGFYIRCIKDN